MAHYKKVRKVAFVPSIPKSTSGKILRRELVSIATSRLWFDFGKLAVHPYTRLDHFFRIHLIATNNMGMIYYGTQYRDTTYNKLWIWQPLLFQIKFHTNYNELVVMATWNLNTHDEATLTSLEQYLLKRKLCPPSDYE